MKTKKIKDTKKLKVAKYIYTITGLAGIATFYLAKKDWPKTKKEQNILNSWRCFGWISNLKTAKLIVENNDCDIHEYFYKYIVIEKIADGMHGGFKIPKEWWYEWVSSNEEGHYISIEKPEELKHTINFGLG